MTKTAMPGQYLLVANASPGDRGDLVAVCDTEDDLIAARRSCGLHPGVLSEVVAGKGRTPRGCEVDYDDAGLSAEVR